MQVSTRFQLNPPPGYVQRPDGLQRFRQAPDIEILLDGVVFASGQFVGSDGGKQFETMLASSTVPPQIGSKVLMMRDAGEPVSKIAKWLESTGSQPVNMKVDGWWTTSAAGRAARQLMRVYQKSGEAQLYETARSFAQIPVVRLYR